MMKRITKAQVIRLRELNAKCVEAERQILEAILPLDEELKARVENPDDKMYDYELNVEVTFYCSIDEDKYADPIAQCNYYVKHCTEDGRSMLIGDSDNRNQFSHRDGHPLSGEHFCYMFHDLTDHHRKYPSRKNNRNVTLKELLLIDIIYVDIIPNMQYETRF